MKKSPSRSIDVARLAGVSRSAVSRAFTAGTYISPETREKVLRAAEMLDYSPNVIARSLTMQRTNIIGIVTTDLQNAFYAQLLEEMSRKLQAQGFATLLIVTDRQDSDAGIVKLLSYQVDAVILSAVMLSSKMTARCQQWGRPVVLVDRYIESDSITSISGSNIAGAAGVADLLVDGGHERIAFMSGYPDTSSSRDRERGFRDQLARRGRLLYGIESGDYTHEGASSAIRRLLDMRPRPDAVFCANDLMAMAALDVIRSEFGLSVPRDISIVGYDNSPRGAGPGYQLTSVEQNVAGMAEMAVSAVIRRITHQAEPVEHLSMPSRLVVRNTTRPV
jgi:DNA-binding LacI/PurR family transcriptional regulator